MMRDIIKDIYEEYTRNSNNSLIGKVPVNRMPFTAPPARAIQLGRLIGRNKRILDVGVSCGEIAQYLVNLGNEVIGLDISERYANQCRLRGIEVRVCNIESDELPNMGMFDVVIMTEILEHLIDPLKVLREKIYHLLNPQGRLFVSVPNCAYLKFRLSLCLGRLPNFGEFSGLRPYNLLHKTFFTIPALIDTLKQANFSPNLVTQVEYDRPSFRFRFLGVTSILRYLCRIYPEVFVSDVLVGAVKISGKQKGL